MILAAGFGTRLRPLTDRTPKPLLPVANSPLLEYGLALLAAGGVGEVIVNCHHLAGEFETGLRRLDCAGLEVHLSAERKILGTAGGPKKAAPFLDQGPFFLVNGDFLIDFDLREIAVFHRRREAKATMLLREDPEGGIYVDGEGRIRQFLQPGREPSPRWKRCGFTGIHLLEPEVLGLIPARTPWEINSQVYPEMLRREWPVFGLIHAGYWREAGDPSGFLAANLEMLSGQAGGLSLREGAGEVSPPVPCEPPVLVGRGVRIGRDVRLGPGAVIGDGVLVGDGASVRNSVVLEGAEVAEGERLDGAIRGPGATIAVRGGGRGE